MATTLLVVLGLALLSADRGTGAGSRISTSVVDENSTTRLTCTLNDSNIPIVGHQWMKGDKVLQEDTEPGLTTQYEVDIDKRAGQYFCVFLPCLSPYWPPTPNLGI
ncbi:basigin (Ok blood group) [Rhinolophus ferrumequinum]|uniref:Basigin (Ok blood group) n=1 Tax=Rhinolophus ferrumequinum TaxID=59479 RepID=A0A7J7TZ08_RHIFE|nr:basigin (Ok blood group) [Rhinolophus ferrumequinum]